MLLLRLFITVTMQRVSVGTNMSMHLTNIYCSQVADEPAYLTVGTDVSAKYRGAFCEAKIKTVKRMVKVKVRLICAFIL